MRNVLAVAVSLLMVAGLASAASWVGNGGDGQWTTGSNWNTGVAPGTSGTTDTQGIINGGDKTATLDNSSAAIVNTVVAQNSWGGTLTLTGTGTTALTQLQINRYGNANTYVTGGTWNHDGGGQKIQIYGKSGAAGGLYMQGGTFNTATNCPIRFLANGAGTSYLEISGGTWNGGIIYMDDTRLDGANGTLAIVGSNASVRFDALNIHNNPSGATWNTTGTALLSFVADASGVSTVNVGLQNPETGAWTGGTLDLGTGLNLADPTSEKKGDLLVDVTAYGLSGDLTLVNYHSLVNGTFGNVSIMYNGTALDASQYTLDMGTGTDSSISLAYAIPEPATMAMLGIGGIGVLIRRRRRA